MRHLDLFSGIGGFALAADWVWGNVEHSFCEIDDFCQDILVKHWPNSPIYGDIRALTKQNYQRDFGDPTFDLLTGGFPCQPFSVAGAQLADKDDRYLWPEMLRVIKEFQPRWVIGENVAGIIKLALDQVLSDLESEGYSCQAFVIPACAVNAPHRRDRVWIVAHALGERTRSEAGKTPNENWPASQSRRESIRQAYGEIGASGAFSPTKDASHTDNQRREGSLEQEVSGQSAQPRELERSIEGWRGGWPVSKPRTIGVDDGIPDRTHRIKALGNAIVPAVAAEIMKAIRLIDESNA